jgi:hypothetical protein
LALAFSWRALETRQTRPVLLAAICSAAVVAHNFYGANALAIFYAILVWSIWVTRRGPRMLACAAAIPLLAYGRTAFWLVPSYLQVTARNLQYVAERGDVGSISPSGAGGGGLLHRFVASARGRPERTWAVFTAGRGLVFLEHREIPTSTSMSSENRTRLVPELDLAYVPGAITFLRWCWNRPSRLSRSAAAAIGVASLATTTVYLRHTRSLFPVTPDYQSRLEYRISDRLAKNLPKARVMATGLVPF